MWSSFVCIAFAPTVIELVRKEVTLAVSLSLLVVEHLDDSVPVRGSAIGR